MNAAQINSGLKESLSVSFTYITLALLLLSCLSCERLDNGNTPYIPSLCSLDSLPSAGDVLWSHGEGDLQNTKRAPGLRVKGCITGPVDTPHVVWSFPLGGPGTLGAPVIGDDGTIYIVGEYPGEPLGGGLRNAGILAISQSGSLKWFFSTPTDIGIALADNYGESVTIGPDGTIYYAGWDSTLYALNKDGKVKWKYNKIRHLFTEGSGFPSLASPVIDENGFIYTANDTVFCFTSKGKIRWKFHNDEFIGSCTQISLGKNRIYCGFYEHGILALDYSGNKQWFYPVNFEDGDGKYGILLDEDENLYFKIDGYNLLSLDRNGSYRWQGSPGVELGGITQPALRGDYLYAGSFGFLFKIDKTTGAWVADLSNFIPSYVNETTSPLVDDDGVIYLAHGTRDIQAVRDNGEQLWQLKLDVNPGEFEGYMALGPDGTLYVAKFSPDQPAVYQLYALKR